MRTDWLSWLLVCILAGCAAPPTAPDPAPTPAAPAAPTARPNPPGTPGAAPASRPPATVQSKLLGRSVQAQPARPLNVQTQCRFENETGYYGNANVEVRNGQVHQLAAEFNVPGQGQCRIDLSNLRQTRSLPSVELRDGKSACTARMWEQGDKATVAFSNCASYCSRPEAFAYVWPILISRGGTRCD